MDPILLSFVISYGAGIAIDLKPKLSKIIFKNDTVEQQIKSCFIKSLETWCPNVDIRERNKEKLLKNIEKIVENPKVANEIFDSNPDLQTFQTIFEKELAKTNYQAAYNYLKSVSDKTEFKNINTKLSEIIEVLEEHRTLEVSEIGHEPIISDFYINRDIDQALFEKISNERILLLTGESFCGKSEVSKRIAFKFVNKGYIYKRVDDVKEAISFLSIKNTRRICVLEDPFGHSFSSEKPNELRDLNTLIENIGSENFLIVTTRTEVLINVSGVTSINEIQTAQKQWVDLSNTDYQFLIELWDFISNERKLLGKNISKINEYLKKGNILQIGQLIHLSRISELKERELSLERLVHLAQVDAKELSAAIFNINDKTWLLMSIFAINLDTINGISFNDFEYIFSKTKNNLSLEEHSIFAGTEFSNKKKSFNFPKYPETDNSINDFTNEISFLEKRGYIKLVKSKYTFSHPQYKEIAKYVFKGLSSLQQSIIITNIFNSFSCLNIEVAHNTSKSLNFIFESFNQSFHEELYGLVYQIYDESLFPKVIDKCFIFLLNNLDKIQSEELVRNILFRLGSTSEESNIIYYDSQPIKWRESDYFKNYFDLIDITEYEEICFKISKDEFVSIKEIFQALKYQRVKRAPSNNELIMLGLKSDEAFIRNISAYNYMTSIEKLSDVHILDSIFQDEHPSVIFNALKAFFENLNNYEGTLFEYCFDKFKSLFKNDKIFCIRSSSLMTTFATDYAHESINWREIEEEKSTKIWHTWGDLFPIFLNNFPTNVRFPHTPRFSGTIRSSIKKITPNQGIVIAENLFKYIYNNLNKRLFDSHELILSDYLIDVTENSPELRYALFKKIFAVKDTGFFIYSYSWIVSKWEKLSEDEKEFITNILSSNRKDLRWIKAGMISSFFLPPKKIQKAIFNNELYFEQNLPDIVNKMNSKLLSDALKIYTGDAHIIDWYGLSHGNEIWRNVCKYILENDYKIGFQMSLSHFLNDFVNGAFHNGWGNMKDLWKEIFNRHNKQEYLLNSLIEEISKCTCNLENIKSAFKTAIKWYEKNDKTDELVTIICDKIEIITKTSHNQDLITFLSYKKFLFKKIIPALANHEQITSLLYDLKTKKLDEHIVNEMVNKVVELAESNQIRLYFIFDFINSIAEQNRIGEENIKKLRNIPNLIRYTQDNYKNEEELHDDYHGLVDWVSLLGEPDLVYDTL